jgi:hypothetical protein
MREKFSALKILAKGPKAKAGSRKPGLADIYQSAKLPRVRIPNQLPKGEQHMLEDRKLRQFVQDLYLPPLARPAAPSSIASPGRPTGAAQTNLILAMPNPSPGKGQGLSSPSRDFLRHDSGVRGWERKRPLNGKPLRASCASAHRRSGYSSPSCVPAQFGSASPDIRIVPESSKTRRRSVDTFRGSHWGQLGSYWFVVPSARDRSPTR